MDIRDVIEEKYTNYLNYETDNLDLTIEEAKFILANDKKTHFVDDLLFEAYKVVLSELEKKDKEYEELTEASKELCKTVNLMKKVINEMAKHIHLSGDYECLNKECEDDESKDCEECIKEYFTNEVEKEGIKDE